VLAKNATAKSKKENEVEMGFQLNKWIAEFLANFL
jgi:hypothetical protein